MTCLKCNHTSVKRFGYYGRRRIQRYRCTRCSSTFSAPPTNPLGRRYLDFDKATQVIALMVEGMDYHSAWEVVRELYIILPSEDDEPEPPEE